MNSFEEFLTNLILGIDSGSLSGCLAVISSLYIPVAILIYQEFKGVRAFNEFEWDKTVLLQKVIKGWQILASILLCSVAIILWNYKSVWFRLFLIYLIIACISILSINLVHLYKWLISNKIGKITKSDYRQEQKINFLKELNPNSSLDVWSNLFSTIEPENAYLKDYLAIFFDKFSHANEDNYWQYSICLTQNMDRLYYLHPDFQKEIINFSFDAYINNNENTKCNINVYKREIIRKLFKLLANDSSCFHYSVSDFFDKKLSTVKSDLAVINAVFDYSGDILRVISGAYYNISTDNTYSGYSVFPLNKWNICSLPDSKDKKANAKAVGLLMSFLEMLPHFIKDKNDRMDIKRASFLEQISFGLYRPKLSMSIIRVVCLFYNQGFYSLYENEDINHARIRKFIDNDYGFYFMDSSVLVSTFSGFDENDEQMISRLFDEFRSKEDIRDDNTLKILADLYGFESKSTEIDDIIRSIRSYDLSDDKYRYKYDKMIIESNINDLEAVFNKISIFIKRGLN